MKIHVSSRDAVNDTIKSLNGSVSVISITDPNSRPVELKCNEQFVLRQQFHDLDRIHSKPKEFTYFSCCHAREIVDFVLYHMSDNIVVHCEAGVSRSPAIAAAISQYFCIPTWSLFRRYIPNLMVFTILMNEFGFLGVIRNEND